MIECRTFDIERHGNIRYRRFRYRVLIRYRRFLHSNSILYIDIEGVRYRRSHYSISKIRSQTARSILVSKVTNRTVDIELSSFRYRKYIIRYRTLRSYTISKAAFQVLTFDIEGHIKKYRVRYRYRIRYNLNRDIHTMSFTAERKLPLPRLHHAAAELGRRVSAPRALDS
jgi:hypothetical protein